MSHKCFADGCSVIVGDALFMCFGHWYMLEESTKMKIYAHYRTGQKRPGEQSAEFWAAAEEAIKQVK